MSILLDSFLNLSIIVFRISIMLLFPLVGLDPVIYRQDPKVGAEASRGRLPRQPTAVGFSWCGVTVPQPCEVGGLASLPTHYVTGHEKHRRKRRLYEEILGSSWNRVLFAPKSAGGHGRGLNLFWQG